MARLKNRLPRKVIMKNRTLIISIILVCLTITLAFAVATYAIWEEQANDYIDVEVPTSDFNPSLKYIVYEGLDASGNFTSESPVSYAVVGYSGIISELVIPESYNGLAVTKISCSSTQLDTNFAGNGLITSIVIPGSVTKIDQGVFASLTRLKEVTIEGDGELVIEDLAFAGCVSLETFTTARTISGNASSYLMNTPLVG